MKHKLLLSKLFVCVGSITLAGFCLIGYKSQQSHKNSFPQDLMCNGSPIHPSCVVSTQFGDSFRLEPKIVMYTTAIQLQEYDYTVHSDVCTFNPETQTVTAECKYSPCDRDLEDFKESYGYNREPEISEESYQYIGSYKNKHIVITRHHDTSGTGRFSELGLVIRDGDTICNAGEITGGDRAHGGIIDVLSFKDNILRFKQIAPFAEIGAIVPYDGNGDSLPDSSHSQGLWFVYEVNLDDPKLTAEFCGISFFDKQDYDLRYTGGATECFYRLAHESIDAGKQILDVEESKTFVKNVWQSIAALECNVDQDEIVI